MVVVLFSILVVVIALIAVYGAYIYGVEVGKKVGIEITDAKYKEEIKTELREVVVD